MKKRIKGRKLGRNAAQRKALYHGLITALIEHERIQTTEAKAKEIRPRIAKYITRARRGDIHAIRILRRNLSERSTMKLVREIAPRYRERPGGYTRIIKLPPRNQDGARLALIEFV